MPTPEQIRRARGLSCRSRSGGRVYWFGDEQGGLYHRRPAFDIQGSQVLPILCLEWLLVHSICCTREVEGCQEWGGGRLFAS